MKTTVTETTFIDAFKAIRPDNFSYNGLRALYEWFEQYEEDCGEEIELDVIAICCDFSEYESLKDFALSYYPSKMAEWDDDEIQQYIEENGMMIEFEGGIIIQDF